MLGLTKNQYLSHFRRSRVFVCQETNISEAGKDDIKSPIQGSSAEVTKGNISILNSQTAYQYTPPPLVSALEAAAIQKAATFHFPGHNRGRAAPSSLIRLIGMRPFLYDLGELPELGSFFPLEGPIMEAQKEAAKLFGSSETWFLVGGTTCGIQAAIMATCSPGDTLILPRNSHMSAISAMILSGALPHYIFPEYDSDWEVAGGVTPSQIEKAVKELETKGTKAAAVFVTSPTYHGICSDLSAICHLCHSYGTPVIVDEAHGAHLGFHPQMPKSALQQGADLVVQSTHKVLCSLTQSSMLHISGSIVNRERIRRCLQILQSTSPSMLLLASLDAARAQISKNPETIFNEAMELSTEAKSSIEKIPGISLLDFPSFSSFPAIDPMRLTLGFWKLGLSGYEADEILSRDQKVIPEIVGTRSITIVISMGTCRDHLLRLVAGLKQLSEAFLPFLGEVDDGVINSGQEPLPFTNVSVQLSVRDAFFASKRRVNIRESLGEICGELICPYPPGTPVLCPGEIITEEALDYLLGVRVNFGLIAGPSDPTLSSIFVCE